MVLTLERPFLVWYSCLHEYDGKLNLPWNLPHFFTSNFCSDFELSYHHNSIILMSFNTFFVLELFMLFFYILPLHKMVRPSSSGCLSELLLYFPFYIWCLVDRTYQYIFIELMDIIIQGKNGQKLGHYDQLKVSRWGDPKIMKINQRDVSLWQRQRSKRKMCTCITGHLERGTWVKMRIKTLDTSGENPEVQGENWLEPGCDEQAVKLFFMTK